MACRSAGSHHSRSVSTVLGGLCLSITLGLAIALVPATSGFAAPIAVAPPSGAISTFAFDSKLEGDANSTTLQITLSQAVEAKAFVLEAPDRLVIDLPAVNFQLSLEAGRKAVGLVKAYRFGLFAPGRSRIVIDLAQPASAAKISTEALAGGAATLTIELRRIDRSAFSKLAKASSDTLPAAPASITATAVTTTPRAGDMRPIVVLDPGHGGLDVGATGLGNVLEKDLVFGFARSLKDKLERSGTVRVVLTRDTDVFIALGERVRIARALNAALFVSIHADTLTASPDVRGLTVYTGSEKATDAEAARLAESENRADAVAGVEQQETREDVADILDDLTKRETRVYSGLFAKTLVAQMGVGGGRLNKNPHRSAGFRVLRAPDVPSVLLELGYLSSKSDMELMKAPDWREKATEQLASAIMDFLAPRLTLRTLPSQP